MSEFIMHICGSSQSSCADAGLGLACTQVVEENKRQLCVYKIASDKKEPWKWWTYAADFAEHCTMKNGRFADRCRLCHGSTC